MVLASPDDFQELFGAKAKASGPKPFVCDIGLVRVAPNIYVKQGKPVLVEAAFLKGAETNG